MFCLSHLSRRKTNEKQAKCGRCFLTFERYFLNVLLQFGAIDAFELGLHGTTLVNRVSVVNRKESAPDDVVSVVAGLLFRPVNADVDDERQDWHEIPHSRKASISTKR